MHFFSKFFSKEESIRLCVTSSNGFHLRPIAQFVLVAKRFPCQIFALAKGKKVDAKTVNSLLSLTLEKNNEFILITKGKQAKEALLQLEKTFKTLMSNDIKITPQTKEKNPYNNQGILGESIYQGIVIAPLYFYKSKEIKTKTQLTFQEACQKVLEELKSDENEIYIAQRELLLSLFQDILTLEAFEKVIKDKIEELKNSILSTKKADYQDILSRIKKHLGVEIQMITPKFDFILVAQDLLPCQIEALTKNNYLKGVILKETTINSHTAILLRSAGIIAFISNKKILKERKKIILDTFASLIIISPKQSDIKLAKKRIIEHKKLEIKAQENRFNPVKTSTDKTIKVLANVSDITSVKQAKEEGAEGIGLLRTEFLFTEEEPTLNEQIDIYSEIFSLFTNITIRTIDIGGDKALPYINLPHENNPFLGIRGIRLLQTHANILETQLHAILSATRKAPLKIMFPMISTVEEFEYAKKFTLTVARKYYLDTQNISFGIMIEVPSVLFLIKEFNKVVDFYSIGTNDLTQYLFATERTHPTLKVDELSTVVFDAIKMIMRQTSKPVSICGELASNKNAIAKLIELGLETLSVSPKSIATTKEKIRKI